MPIRVDDRARPHGGLVRTITLDRPQRRNALDAEHLQLLAGAIAAVDADARVRCVVVGGEGVAFCSGYDLGAPFPPEGPLPDSLVVRVMAAVRACRVPVIAKVHGAAFGAGLELAISADLRLAAPEAKFCLPPAKLGIAYGAPGLARLAQLAGTSGARRLAWTGEVITAAEALSLGLVERVLEIETLASEVERLADAIADNAPLAIAAMKRTFNALEDLDPALLARADFDRATCYASDDAAEGVAAFAAKRPPDFKGR